MMRIETTTALTALIIVAAATLTTPAVAADAACPSSVELGERIIASTVTVLSDGDAGIMGSGSGFFIGDDLVATNWHVVHGSKALRVKLSNEDEPRGVLGVVAGDLANDLAIIKLKPPSVGTPLTMSDHIPKRGARIFAFGSPRLLEATMSDGIVSAERDVEGAQRIQITAAVSPGSSGGPVTDDCGRVIGIAYMKVKDSENLNFAIPAHFLMTLKGSIGEPRAADDVERAGSAALRQVTASRLGVPDGVDVERWVQIDAVAQRFFVGLGRRELAGAAFFTHVGHGELLTDADNSFATLMGWSAALCGAASVCTCALSVPLLPVGIGFITGTIGGVGLCTSAGLATGSYVTWQDHVAPDLPFSKRAEMARAHNATLSKRADAKANRKAAGGVDDDDNDVVFDDRDQPVPPLPLDGPAGDNAPPPLSTPTPSLDAPPAMGSGKTPRMQF